MKLSPDGTLHVDRDEMARQSSAEIKGELATWMHETLNDQIQHALFVAAGRTHFREAFVKRMGAYFGMHKAPCDDLANNTWQFLFVVWRQKYPDMSPSFFLDKVEVKSPYTEKEIEDGWELEIAGSEAALRAHYEGGARIRRGTDLGAKANPEKPKVH